MKENRTPIAFVEATVRFPLYDGDHITGRTWGTWDWFEYSEPGITENGELGTCARQCTVLQASVIPAEIKPTAKS